VTGVNQAAPAVCALVEESDVNAHPCPAATCSDDGRSRSPEAGPGRRRQRWPV